MAKKRAPVQDEEMTVGEMLRTPAEPRVEAGKMQVVSDLNFHLMWFVCFLSIVRLFV